MLVKKTPMDHAEHSCKARGKITEQGRDKTVYTYLSKISEICQWKLTNTSFATACDTWVENKRKKKSQVRLILRPHICLGL